MVQRRSFRSTSAGVDPVLNKYFLADRSNKSIDILDLSTSPPTLTQVVNTGFAGFTGNNDTSGPDGVVTANNHTEIWVGDNGSANGGPGRPGRSGCLTRDASVKHYRWRTRSRSAGQREPMNLLRSAKSCDHDREPR